MDDSFHIHLASNVAPETFPNNTPSDFKTPLAEELRLHGATWEVAVKDIMYPSYVSSTTTADKLYFHKYNINVDKDIPYAVKNGRYVPYTETLHTSNLKDAGNKAKYICDAVNSSYLGRRNVIQLEYREHDAKKFILHLFKYVLLSIDVSLQTYLGFNQRSFYKGSHWSWTSFNENAPTPESIDLQVRDIHALQTQTRTIKRIPDMGGAIVTADTIVTNEKSPKEHKRTFELYVSKSRLMAHIKEKGEFTAIEFDEETAKALLIEQYHPIDEKDGLIILNLDLNGKGLSDVKKHSITLYSSTPKPSTFAGMSKTPDDFIELSQNTNYKSPRDFLKQLNSKAEEFKYKFIFSPSTARFKLENQGNHCIKMTESLATILGFEVGKKQEFLFCEKAHRATYPPVLHRGINNLFIYSNIVNSVLVGNTKAPLLLTCAFKKSVQDIMVHQEFLNPTFVPISHSSIHQIDILIRDEVGQPIPFLYGKTVLTLQFRKRRI